MKSPWIVCNQERPEALVRLFCFPPAGGNSTLYRSWHDSMPPEVEVLAVELPGRQTRIKESPIPDLNRIIDEFVPVLEAVGGPFVLFGHSMGGLISFEITRRLRREGRRLPELLIVSGRKAPQTPERFPIMHTLAEPDFIKSLESYGGTPRAVLEDRELLDIFVPLLRADFTVFESHEYRSEPPLPVPLVVFGGDEDERAIRSELQAWRIHTSADFRLHMIPGAHFFLRDNPTPTLAALNAELTRVIDHLR